MMFNNICALPTWILGNIFTEFLPKSHPWKNRWFKLSDWANVRTETTKYLDFALWGQIIFLIILSSLTK